MFKFNAYCFSPELISSRIADVMFFEDLLSNTTSDSPHHILLDYQETLWLDYLERTQGDSNAFQNLKVWRALIDSKRNRILFAKVDSDGEVSPEFISQIAIKSPATCKKYIVTNDNDFYADNIRRLNTYGVDLLSEFNMKSSLNASNVITYNSIDFYHHMLEALCYVASTRANKLENEHNDYLRDLLSFKGYIIKDQTRLGQSATKKGIGSLDLAVFDNQNIVTIIEPLRLSSVDKSYIVLHYNKLIINYNPLYLTNTHIVVYFVGPPSGFNDFFDRYMHCVTSLGLGDFANDISFESVHLQSSGFQGVRSFIQQGKVDGQDFNCSHTCISFNG